MKKPRISVIHELGTIRRGHEKGLPMSPDSIGLSDDCANIPRIGETVKLWGENRSLSNVITYPVVVDVEHDLLGHEITIIVGRR